MKVVRSINDWDELEALLQETGPLLSVPDAAMGLRVSRRTAYRLCEDSKLRVFAVFGAYYVPFSDIQGRRNLAQPETFPQSSAKPDASPVRYVRTVDQRLC